MNLFWWGSGAGQEATLWCTGPKATVPDLHYFLWNPWHKRDWNSWGRANRGLRRFLGGWRISLTWKAEGAGTVHPWEETAKRGPHQYIGSIGSENAKRKEPGCSWCCQATGRNWYTGSSTWTCGRTSLWEWLSTGKIARRGFGVSLTAGYLKAIWTQSWIRYSIRPSCHREIGQSDLQWSLPILNILWFCEKESKLFFQRSVLEK